MLLEVNQLTKSLGHKHLFEEISFSISEKEKIAVIGRNGHGKTTLLKILSGEDHDFEGNINRRRGIRIILTRQEHIHDTQQSALEYILKSVPDYFEFKKIMDEFEQDLNEDYQTYLQTIEHFTQRKYFNIVDSILSTLEDFQISPQTAQGPLAHLSGGEKRYVEMVRMMFSQGDLLLIDEPTNHLDFKGKQRFISWMKSFPKSMVVVTHDRDVLQHVQKIIELKDQKITVFKGNYDSYISQNATNTLSSVKQYTDQLNRLKEAKKRVEWGLQMRAKSKQWKIRYDHWLKDYEKIKAETVKPSFWIDQNTVEEIDQKVVGSYHKFKEKNIKITANTKSKKGVGELIAVRHLSLGYAKPIFEDMTFTVMDGERVFIKGRNGVGKSTLVRTIMSLSEEESPKAKQFGGEIKFESSVKIGEYQQEISHRFLEMTLEDAIRNSYLEKNVGIEERQIKALMAQYLFHPVQDAQQKIRHLSGGQKARFQLIRMFISDPNVLILDEPTNHLDLPSIEELENALDTFSGGIVYISHDTYFIHRIGGKVIEMHGS